jgi:flagellar biosynthesis protein FlhG
MIKDQAYELKKMMKRLNREKELKKQADEIKKVLDTNQERTTKLKHIIAVTSGKGGVGKSTLSTNLSLYFSSRGIDTILIDADLGLANIDLMLGIKSKYNLKNVISGEKPMLECLESAPFGLRVLTGASGIANIANIGEAEREYLLEEISELQYETELLLIDTGAGLSDNVMRFLLISDTIVVIITDEPASLSDGYGVIKSLSMKKFTGNIMLIMNRFRTKEEGKRIFGRIHYTCKEFLGIEVKLAGVIVDSNIIKQSSKKMKPLILEYPNNSICLELKRTGDSILGLEPQIQEENKERFIKKLYRVFWREKQ